ncbi:amidohydrolase [Elioraea sp.]|uniref:amidohydrolase n=1 Tax=Elioraea sp. TaxID=2185103 RepID=UPI003F6F1E91
MPTEPHGGLDRRTLLAATATGGAAALAGADSVLAQAQPPSPAAAGPGTPPPSAAMAARAVEAVREPILRISREVWATPELSLHEAKSSEIHIREIEAQGFRIVSRGTAGVPTAFLAEWSQGSGGAKIGYLPEYDALPSLGNAAEPRQVPGPTGAEVGHGCGHNMIGAGCTGAAFALKRMMQEAGAPGTIRIYGCAAEEVEGAKVYMAREDLFADLDAALAWHPAPVGGAGIVWQNALQKAKVMFHGRSAHAGNAPWEGRSALKAAELFGLGIQMMREHVLPTARIHYIYERAGTAPNVVPDFAQIWIVVRDRDMPKVQAMMDWMQQIAEGAAMATQTRAEADAFFGTHDLMPNEPLARLLYRHLETVPLDWTAEEQAFARTCQKEMGLREAGMATRLIPFVTDGGSGGSTDLGDVSWQTPTGVFAWPTMPLGVGLHTWPVTACGGMSIGDKSSIATAAVLAAAGFDLMTDPALREAARADFRRRIGDRPFRSAIPASRTRPLGVPEYLIRTGEDEIVSALRPSG